jgi:hypothetical protein
MRLALLALAVAAFASGAGGQTGSAPGGVFQVDFSNPSLTPSNWTLTLHPDGSGHFHSERGSARVKDSQESQGAPEIDAPDVDRDVDVSARFAEHVFETARRHRLFHEDCDSHLKVAFQGWKKLSYSGAEGTGSCGFNYAKDKEIEALGDSLVAVAETILEGARLEKLLRYDRLGLDKEMEFLVEAAGDGRVQQISAIRGILERVAEDDEVLERVRKRSRELLMLAER